MQAADRFENLKLSIAVAAPDDRASIGKFLDQFLFPAETVGRENIEIVIANNLSEKENEDLTNYFDANVVFAPSRSRFTLPQLWAAAIERSTGDVIAVTDSSCKIPPNWTGAIRAAHLAENPVVGGAVEYSEKMSLVTWAAYFCEYGQFMQPVENGVVEVLPGNNISFKRDLLKRQSRFVAGEFWKSHLCRELQNEGLKLISDPSIEIGYGKEHKLGNFLKRRFLHGRCFAGMRVEKAGRFRRLIYAAGTVILPVIFLIRTAKPVIRKRRFVGKFVMALPISLLAICSWSIGETVGYLAGKGKSAENIY